MALEPRHFKEELQDLLDDRLSPEVRLAVEQHLVACAECRREFEALGWVKRFSRQQCAAAPAPPNLEKNILQALDLADRSTSAKPAPPRNWWAQRRALLAYSLALTASIALLLAYFIFRPAHPTPPEAPSQSATLPAAVAQDWRAYQAGQLPLLRQTGEVAELERFFAAEGIAFNTRVFDLGMMNYHLAGGRVHQLAGRPSAFFVYRGKDGQPLVCQMYLGQTSALPLQGATLRDNKGIRFYVYRVAGLTVVFWQEGAVICVLASDSDSEEVVQLAFAKAVKL